MVPSGHVEHEVAPPPLYVFGLLQGAHVLLDVAPTAVLYVSANTRRARQAALIKQGTNEPHQGPHPFAHTQRASRHHAQRERCRPRATRTGWAQGARRQPRRVGVGARRAWQRRRGCIARNERPGRGVLSCRRCGTCQESIRRTTRQPGGLGCIQPGCGVWRKGVSCTLCAFNTDNTHNQRKTNSARLTTQTCTPRAACRPLLR